MKHDKYDKTGGVQEASRFFWGSQSKKKSHNSNYGRKKLTLEKNILMEWGICL